MAARIQLPFSFDYPAAGYIAATSGGAVTTAANVLEPVVGASVTIIDRDTSSAATVFAAETGSSTITSVVTDSGGNIPGWVTSGSYRITVASIGAFGGAVINFEAVRGDGVERIAPGAINTSNIVPGSITASLLDPVTVGQFLHSPGMVEETASATLPAGWLWCDGSIVAQATYPNLFGAIGAQFNTGGEGAGNFRLPDARQRFVLGKAASGVGSTLGATGGSLDHTHTVPALSIPDLTLFATTGNHSHSLSGAGGAMIAIVADTFFGGPSFDMVSSLSLSRSFSGFQEFSISGHSGFLASANTNQIPALTGFTDAVGNIGVSGVALGASQGRVTGTGVTGTESAVPAFIALNRIIKY